MVKKRILCFGDSNTWGYVPEGQPETGEFHLRFEEEIRWTGVMQKCLGSSYVVVEEGLNGRTTVWDDEAAPYRNGLAFLPPLLLSHAPLDLVVIMLGTNDLKSRICADLSKTVQSVELLIAAVRESKTGRNGGAPEVLVISPIEVGEYLTVAALREEFGGFGAHELSKKMPALYREAADKYRCAFLNGALFACPGADGIHMDAENHAELGIAVAEKIKTIL